MYSNATSMRNQVFHFFFLFASNLQKIYIIYKSICRNRCYNNCNPGENPTPTQCEIYKRHSLLYICAFFYCISFGEKLCLQIRFSSQTASSQSAVPRPKPHRQCQHWANCCFMTVFTCRSVLYTKDVNHIIFFTCMLF